MFKKCKIGVLGQPSCKGLGYNKFATIPTFCSKCDFFGIAIERRAGRKEGRKLESRVSSGLAAGGDWLALWHNLAASLYPPTPQPIHTLASFQNRAFFSSKLRIIVSSFVWNLQGQWMTEG